MGKIIFTLFMLISGFAHAEQDNQEVLALLQQLKASYSKVNSFTVKMQLERFLPDYALQNQLVWFKRPQYIKLRQLGPFKEDAELAIKPDGSIRGHLGGFLSFAVVSLDADDKNLFGVTNDSVFNTDFDAIINLAFELSKRMSHFQISSRMESGNKQIILDTFYRDTVDHYRLIIDEKTMMISGLERYTKQKLLHKIRWVNLVLNPAISNREFDF